MLKELRSAFTLLEVIISLGIIAFISSLFIFNFEPLLNSVSTKSPEKVLNEVIIRCFNLTQYMGEELKLSFDEEENKLLISTYLDNEILEQFDFPIKDIELTFEVIYPSVIDGSISNFKQIEEVDFMRFFPDGSSSKLRINLNYFSKNYTVVYDSFSPIKMEESYEE